MSNAKTPKPWPTLPTDEAAVKFVDEADLSEFDWSKAVPVTMEFRKKNGQLNVRMPEDELTKIRAAAVSGLTFSRDSILTVAEMKNYKHCNMPGPRVQFIIDNLQESLEVEVKNWLNGLQDNANKAKLAKEIIALANNGGGYVFIGFNDAIDKLSEIQPKAGEFEAYTQDAIAAVVHRYVTPPCQCRLEFAARAGSNITHPVIIVPGKHRTPLFAKSGGPNGEVENAKVYVRRPGGYSEPAKNQDDWEKLIERLVKARQSEMLGAIRETIDPSSRILAKEESSIEGWQAESYAAWQQKVGDFEADDPRRLERGHWTVSFAIRPFETENLGQLNTALDREMPRHSGWPPFPCLHRDPVRPRPQGDLITAYLGELQPEEQPADKVQHCDFWRISRDGKGFMLRPMQEDREGCPGEVSPPPVGLFFDWIFPTCRMTEVLKFIEALGVRFGREGAEFELLLTYYSTNGRRLERSDRRYALTGRPMCHVDKLQNRISAPISDIATNLEELVFALLTPIYEQFEFIELPRQLVTNAVADVLAF